MDGDSIHHSRLSTLDAAAVNSPHADSPVFVHQNHFSAAEHELSDVRVAQTNFNDDRHARFAAYIDGGG